MPDYMQDVDMGGERVNFADYSHQLSRSWRALKVWLSLQYFGLAPYRRAVQKCLDLARLAESVIQAAPDMEMLAPASLGIVCFRLRGEGLAEADIERMNQRAQERLNQSGYALLSSTRLSGRYSLRLCILSHGTTADDVRGVLSALREHTRP
jgi:glutamate/tyrosine decarboxylase-like PLP-dependent enzyme